MTEKHDFARGFALLVAATSFMELLDGTIIQTALTQIGSDLGVSVSASALAMSAYFAAVAATIPLTAWFADKYGVRNSFVAGIALFTLASVFCGTSVSFTELLIFRILQGFGGAVMINVGQLSILRSTPKKHLLRATAYLIWPALAAPVLAPPIGGVITDIAGWRWLFFINVPVGLIACALALALAPKQDIDGGHVKQLDVAGALLLATGLFALIPALSLVELGNDPLRLLAIAVGVALCLTASAWMLRAKQPLLDLRLYAIETFRAGNASGALYRSVVATAPVVLTLMFQSSFHWSATFAGLMVMWLFVGNISVKPLANFVVRRYGFKVVIVTATTLGAGTLALSALLTPTMNTAMVAALLAFSGAARSTAFTAYASLQYSDVPPRQMRSANPLSGAVQQVATALGIAVFVGGLSIFNGGEQNSMAFRVVLIVMSLCLLASNYGALRLPKHAGSKVA
jgi:EmrB/QacA subfamily drug resistance transporter